MNVETPDLHLAAFVIATGTPLATTRREGRRVFFGFELAEESWEKLQRDFHSGEGLVSALKMTHALKALKSLVHIT